MVELRQVRIGDLGRVVTGKTPPSAKPELFGHAYPFLTPTDIDGVARYITPDRYLSDGGREYQHRLMLPERAVCVVCIGATIGKVCMTDRPSFTNQQINSVVVNEEEHDPFFVYSLLTTLRDELKANAGGAATPIINKTAFSEIEVRVPPLPVQRRIAGILSAYDELMENNRRRIRLLEAMARALYREWFVRLCQSGNLPKGWIEDRLENALKFVSGNTIGKEDREGSAIPVYGANGIIGHTDRDPNSPPCIVLGKIGSCGSLHRSHIPCWVSNNAFTVLPSKIVSLDVAWHLLNTIDFRQFIGGAANPYMPINNFGHLPVLIPPELEQIKFDALVAPLSQLQWTLERQTANLRRTRDLLLPRLLSGQVEMADVEAAL